MSNIQINFTNTESIQDNKELNDYLSTVLKCLLLTDTNPEDLDKEKVSEIIKSLRDLVTTEFTDDYTKSKGAIVSYKNQHWLAFLMTFVHEKKGCVYYYTQAITKAEIDHINQEFQTRFMAIKGLIKSTEAKRASIVSTYLKKEDKSIEDALNVDRSMVSFVSQVNNAILPQTKDIEKVFIRATNEFFTEAPNYMKDLPLSKETELRLAYLSFVRSQCKAKMRRLRRGTNPTKRGTKNNTEPHSEALSEPPSKRAKISGQSTGTTDKEQTEAATNLLVLSCGN